MNSIKVYQAQSSIVTVHGSTSTTTQTVELVNTSLLNDPTASQNANGISSAPNPSEVANSMVLPSAPVDPILLLTPIQDLVSAAVAELVAESSVPGTSSSDCKDDEDYLPPPTTTQVPANEILGLPRGANCSGDNGACDSTTYTTRTTTSTIYVTVHLAKTSSTEDSLLSYGSMPVSSQFSPPNCFGTLGGLRWYFDVLII